MFKKIQRYIKSISSFRPAQVLPLMVIPFILFSSCGEKVAPGIDFKTSTFKKLRNLRETRTKELILHLNMLLDKCDKATGDAMLVSHFVKHHPLHQPDKKDTPTQKFSADLSRHYISEYYHFYDILFVDSGGFVFHSIKEESDYHSNIFSGPLSETLLSKTLKSDPNIKFVDYDQYGPSREPAAFFVRKIEKEGRPLGWILFQLATNSLNSISGAPSGLGRTAEVYITNHQKIMLTDSRFTPKSSIFKISVETSALKEALKREEGEDIIKDYRGINVYSSFRKFEFEGATWVVVAEIDEAEVITQHYSNNKKKYLPLIINRVGKGTTISPEPDRFASSHIKVDINEYASAEAGETITTAGITTCTGVMLSHPKKFAYLGHIHPLDNVYYSEVERNILNAAYSVGDGSHGTKVADLLADMISKMYHYRVYPHERRELSALIVAVHTNSFEKIVDQLVASGMFLSQITVLYGPDMQYASMSADITENNTVVLWRKKADGDLHWTTVKEKKSMGTIMREIL